VPEGFEEFILQPSAALGFDTCGALAREQCTELL
jgi:hypothetical protein